MVFVVRQTPINPLPLPICVYTTLASSCFETSGSFSTYEIPGRLLAYNVGNNVGLDPFRPLVNEVNQQLPYVPGQALVPFNPYNSFNPYINNPNGVLILVQTDRGDIFYGHEIGRWEPARITTIFIVDSSYNPLIQSGIGRGSCRRRDFYGGFADGREEFLL
jgi:hypothetical protein